MIISFLVFLLFMCPFYLQRNLFQCKNFAGISLGFFCCCSGSILSSTQCSLSICSFKYFIFSENVLWIIVVSSVFICLIALFFFFILLCFFFFIYVLFCLYSLQSFFLKFCLSFIIFSFVFEFIFHLLFPSTYFNVSSLIFIAYMFFIVCPLFLKLLSSLFYYYFSFTLSF